MEGKTGWENQSSRRKLRQISGRNVVEGGRVWGGSARTLCNESLMGALLFTLNYRSCWSVVFPELCVCLWVFHRTRGELQPHPGSFLSLLTQRSGCFPDVIALRAACSVDWLGADGSAALLGLFPFLCQMWVGGGGTLPTIKNKATLF